VTLGTRLPDGPVDPLFLDRWSPRAFEDEPLPAETVSTLFEAARWSPSCYNDQPWLFVFGTTEPERATILETLVEFNRAWASRAPLLAVLFARRRFAHDGSPNRWAPFDSGAAWMALALAARQKGLHTHAMAGFDPARAHELLGVSEADYEAMCVIAVGRRGDPELLPVPLRERETPSPRKPLAEVARRVLAG